MAKDLMAKDLKMVRAKVVVALSVMMLAFTVLAPLGIRNAYAEGTFDRILRLRFWNQAVSTQ